MKSVESNKKVGFRPLYRFDVSTGILPEASGRAQPAHARKLPSLQS